MSDHVWSQENIAALVAGGLDAAEAERLERHAADCGDCAETLRRARAFDRSLTTLFAGERPGAGLEDRLIRELRAVPTPTPSRRLTWRMRVAGGLAAAVLLGVFGASFGSLLKLDWVPFPGGSPAPHAWSLKMGTDASAARADREFSYRNDFVESLKGETWRDARESAGTDGAAASVLHRNPRPASGAGGGPPSGAGMGPGGPPAGGAGMGVPSMEPTGKPTMPATSTNGIALGDGKDMRGYFLPSGATTYFGDDATKGKTTLSDGSVPRLASPRPEAAAPSDGPAPGPDASAKFAPAPTPAPPQPGTPPPVVDPAPTRKVIRSGDIEFEVESFDGAAAAVTKLVAAIKGGYIATVNSDKLPNGKTKGSLVVRVPPEALDGLLLDLRRELAKGGELKGVRVGSQDVTKHYTDLESRLKAARTMETRLLEIIKSGKGEIKQLLEAEKELGVWRTKIEEFEGELRYLAHQVGLSTLTVTLTEKSIASAAAVVESERVQTGIEVEDVEKAQREALKAITEAKGRVLKSELKQHAAGQFHAQLVFEVAPDAAGPLRDRLKQLGNVVRLEIDRVQRAESATASVPRDAKVKPGETQFTVSLYNLANVAPRETVTLRLAAADVVKAYRALQEAVSRAKGRVVHTHLNEQDKLNVSGQFDFDVRRTEDAAVQAALAAVGETLSRNVARAAEGENVTDAKVLYRVALLSLTSIPPRETTTLALEVENVDLMLTMFESLTRDAGRKVGVNVTQDVGGRSVATAIYDVPLTAAPGILDRLKNSGKVRQQRTAENREAPEGKLAVARLEVTLSNDLLVPANEGLWAQVRNGLSYSLRGLSLSVSWMIFAVLVLLPWALVIGAVVWVVKRLTREPAPLLAQRDTTPATPAAPS